MHDYLKLTQGPLEPPHGDFAAYILQLQRHPLKALDPSLFADSEALPTPQALLQRARQAKHKPPLNATAKIPEKRSIKRPVTARAQEKPTDAAQQKPKQKPRNGGALSLLFFMLLVLASLLINWFSPSEQISALAMLCFIVPAVIGFTLLQQRRRKRS